jgi:hypothetical protein
VYCTPRLHVPAGCWDDPEPIFKHFFFHAKSNKKPDLTQFSGTSN